MRPNRFFAFALLIVLCLSWLVAPVFPGAAATDPFRLTVEGESILYPAGNDTAVKAEVYDEATESWRAAGSGVSWGQTNDAAGSVFSADDMLTYRPCDFLPDSVNTWDSVATVVYATYTVGGQVYHAEVQLVVYPQEVQNDPVKKALVWLRSRQSDNGSLGEKAGEWAVTAVAAAGYNPVDDAWQRNGKSHLAYLEEYIRNLGDKSTYFKGLTDYARVTMSVASAAYYDNSWRDKLTNFGGVNLIEKLKDAQNPNDGHFGKGAETQLINAHIWAILALKAAGEQISNAEKAKEWLINAQNSDGGWGYTSDFTDPWGGNLSDSNDTADAVRALIALGEIDKSEGTSLGNALKFLKSCQADDGGFFWSPVWGGTGDASSDARVISALKAAGEDLGQRQWKKNDKSPVEHLLSLQLADGSFLYQSETPAWDAVSLAADAVAALAGVPLLELPPPAKPPSGGGAGTISIKIKVLGLDGTVMYPERTIQLGPDEQNPLAALQKITANVETAYGGAYVTAIDGLREKQYGATSGWSYRVNSEVPQVAAPGYRLQEGDYVEWFYVRSVSEASGQPGKEQLSQPVSGDLQEQNKSFPEKLQALESALAELIKVKQTLGLTGKTGELGPLNELTNGVVLTGERPLVELANIGAQKRELAQNKVELHQKVTADLGAVLADAGAEIALAVPAGALKSDTEITVKKIDNASDKNGENGSPPAAPPGYRQISGIYRFGPDGTAFTESATLSLRLVIPPLTRPENLALAWYNKDEGQWKAVPAVVDLNKGLILARLEHFSDFAVFAREEKKSFADVTAGSFGWAKDPIEFLAGAGIAAGVDGTRFEPGRPVTRAEFVSLLVKALAIPEKAIAEKSFQDVRDSDWFAGAAAAAARAGLVKGYTDGTFRPHKAISREEAAAILVRVANLPAAEQKLPFADGEKVSAWARTSVAAAAAHGLVKGFPDGTFQPAAPVNRAECTALVYRLLAID